MGKNPRSFAGSALVAAARFISHRYFKSFEPRHGKEFMVEMKKQSDKICKKVEPYTKSKQIKYSSLTMGGNPSVAVEMLEVEAVPYCYMLWIHGGAFVIGDPLMYRQFTSELAKKCESTVFVPDYRLSPQSVFPDALEDCFKVYFDLVYEYKIPPDKICLAGDSAGGNLCISLLKKLHEHSIEKPKAVILNSPWIDLKFRGASWDDGDDIMTGAAANDLIAWCAKSYAGEKNIREPYISPYNFRRPQFKQILPDHILLQCGDKELIYDSIIAFHKKIDGLGKKIDFEVMTGGWHCPIMFPHNYEQKQQMKQVQDFVRKVF